MIPVKGTEGYAEAASQFTQATLGLDFMELHRPFIEFIPVEPSHVLDVGAGIGRDARVFAEMGHSVVAVEPLADFRTAAQQNYDSSNIQWVDDALPTLSTLENQSARFNFILASAVWHHLDGAEQEQAMSRISQLLRPGGIFALSLRHGPAGVGTHIFPTSGQQTIESAKSRSLEPLLHLANQPSLMQGKSSITWTYMVFVKT